MNDPHRDPFVPFDGEPSGSAPVRVLAPIPDQWVPQSSHAARLRVGARNLDVTTWVSPVDADWPATLAMKRALVAARPAEVVACLEGAEEACDEVAAGVLASVGEAPTGEQGIDALVDTALRVADDLCILQDGDDCVPRLTAAVLCSPNRWRLAEKIGGTMAAIHSPVARYDSDLDSPVNAMLARLVPARPVWRINWGVTNHPALFQPDTPPQTPDMDPADMWLRVEWQTLRRLPVTGAVLFGIRTYVQTFGDFVATRPRPLVEDFADLVLKLPEDVAVYKSIAPYRESIHGFLTR
ncbi:MAG: heme-dependent oxidative N-demethylase family protein [Acidimicrobiales bacterium]